MDCEICGQEKAKTQILMEGRKMIVCTGCSDLGTIIPQEFTQSKPNSLKQQPATPLKAFEGYLVTESFGKKIRLARQKKNLSIKEMAEKIFEKESFLHKIEQGKHAPDEKLTKKLEQFLGIKITEKE